MEMNDVMKVNLPYLIYVVALLLSLFSLDILFKELR